MEDRKEEENEWLESRNLPKHSSDSVECLVFLEEKVNLMISERVKKLGKEIMTIRASSLTVNLLEHQEINSILSGEWIILLGSSDDEYQLYMKRDEKLSLSYTLNVGKGPIYIIDCKSGQHFHRQIQNICCGKLWDYHFQESDTQFISLSLQDKVNNISLSDINSNLNQTLIIIHGLLQEKVIDIDRLVSNLTFNPTEMMERLHHYSKEFFWETDKAKKATLSQSLNEYLPKLIPELCERLNAEVLDKESRVVMVKSPSFVFGDIHGNLQDLYDYESLFWKSGNKSLEESNYVFLGDYVDRGSHSIEVSIYLFLLKLSKPEKFTLVRGNHEVRVVNKSFSFYKECTKKYGNQVGHQVWDQINACFERLPIAAVIDEEVFCCHGGIPKSVTKLEEMRAIPKPLVRPDVESSGAHEILWNDPVESMTTYNSITGALLKERNVEFIANRARSTGFYFTELAVDHFFEVNDFTHCIRAHESVKHGFKIHFGGKVVTVFSSSHYCGRNNSTACIKINNQQIQPVIIKPASDHKNKLNL